jgi:CHAD domain-containing protein
MAYRLKLGEAIDDAYRRIVGEQIELAVHQLAEGEDRVVAVHEARKSLKRVRALLKLVRSGLPRDVYVHEKDRFRDIARGLAGTRDSDVLRATASRLAEDASAKARKVAATIAAKDRDDADGTGDAGKAMVGTAIDALEAARTELATLRFDKKRFAVVRRGIETTYRNGRRAMREVLDEHHDEAFHEWRKAVQAHWRQMQLLSRAWPDVFESRATLAKEISELLGEDHDLAVLIERLAPAAVDGGETSGSAELIVVARRRQEAIRAELHPKGDALYAESPPEFAERIAAYWSAAKAARRLARGEAGEAAVDAPKEEAVKHEPAKEKPARPTVAAKGGRTGAARSKPAPRAK